MKNQILIDLRREMHAAADEVVREWSAHFFREEVKLIGLKTPQVRDLAKKAWLSMRELPRAEVLEICDDLWRSGYLEEAGAACVFTEALHKSAEPADMALYSRWVHECVDNWATCDTLCTHTVGWLVERFPHLVEVLKEWAGSPNHWVRRAAAVSLIVPARRGLFLDEALQIALTMLHDRDDMVQKGYGWMLKAASMSENFVKGDPEIRQAHLTAVFDFVMCHRATMPRTALRYAIEKMPPHLRAEAMKR